MVKFSIFGSNTCKGATVAFPQSTGVPAEVFLVFLFYGRFQNNVPAGEEALCAFRLLMV